jgi:hypothetical protein
MSSFDPIAIVVDWLDAYRAGEVESVLGFYDEATTLDCACGGAKTIMGKTAVAEYWRLRLADPQYRAAEIEDIAMGADDSAVLDYATPKGPVKIVFEFNENGKIIYSRCAPVTSPGGTCGVVS